MQLAGHRFLAGRVVLAQEDIAPTTEAIGERDDPLAALTVQVIRRDAQTRTVGHADQPFLCSARKTSALRRGFRPHFRPPEGTPNLRSAWDFLLNGRHWIRTSDFHRVRMALCDYYPEKLTLVLCHSLIVG